MRRRLNKTTGKAPRTAPTKPPVAAILATGFLLAACQQQQLTMLGYDISNQPFPSPYSGIVPQTYGTPFDCRTFSGTGWKGISAGTVYYGDTQRAVSQAGCFQARAQCEDWLSFMKGYMASWRYFRCEPHLA